MEKRITVVNEKGKNMVELYQVIGSDSRLVRCVLLFFVRNESFVFVFFLVRVSTATVERRRHGKCDAVGPGADAVFVFCFHSRREKHKVFVFFYERAEEATPHCQTTTRKMVSGFSSPTFGFVRVLPCTFLPFSSCF